MISSSKNCRILFLLVGLLLSFQLRADDGDILARNIRFPKSKASVYQLLEKITEQTGYQFIYDSNIIDNEKTVKIKAGNYTIREAIYQITGNRVLNLKIIGSHILLTLPEKNSQLTEPLKIRPTTINNVLVIEGILKDLATQENISAGNIEVLHSSLGTVSNQEGHFRLQLSDSLRSSSIRFSHLGYEPKTVNLHELAGKNNVVYLTQHIYPIQEVIVRITNPLHLLREMEEKKSANYSHKPVYLTSFYREGIEQGKRFVRLTEAIFKIYKSSYQDESSDKVKLLKMRNINNLDPRDTLTAKIKSGINACLDLDVIKNMPDFLTPESGTSYYDYATTDIAQAEGRLSNVVSFSQKSEISEPLFTGNLYIDAENSALLRANFEATPEHIRSATDLLIAHKAKNYSITAKRAVYSVSYKEWNGSHYISHVRGDLFFRVRKKKIIPFSSTLHVWFEMATCKIDTANVTRFTRQETLPRRTIISDIHYNYDSSFWEMFNFIPPEASLSNSIEKISSHITEEADK